MLIIGTVHGAVLYWKSVLEEEMRIEALCVVIEGALIGCLIAIAICLIAERW